MFRKMIAATAFALALSPAALAQDGTTPKFSVKTSTIGQILDHPEAKAAFTKVLPDVAANDQIEQARDMTFDDVKSFAPDYFPDAKLQELDAELAKIK
jgi:hypothetical protein